MDRGAWSGGRQQILKVNLRCLVLRAFPLLIQLGDELAAQAIERGNCNVAVALELVVELPKLVAAVTKAAELCGKGLGIEWPFVGFLQGLLTADGDPP